MRYGEQHLESLSESNCGYHNTDRLTGVLAPIVYLFFGVYMRRGFRDVGEGLKCYLEACYAKSKTDHLALQPRFLMLRFSLPL